MKTPIIVILSILACACAEPMSQTMAADGATAQPMPDARPAVVIADAAPIDEEPGPVETEYPCTDMPRINFYDGQGRNYTRLTFRYADIGDSRPGGVVETCEIRSDASLNPYANQECTGDTVSCMTTEGPWPVRACQQALPLSLGTGRFVVSCGILHETATGVDGAFDVAYDTRYTVRVIS